MDKDEAKIERRVNHAVILERIDGRLRSIEGNQADCKAYRMAVDKRIEQVDVEIRIMKTKQNGIIRGFYIVVVGFIGVFAKIIYNAFHH